MGIDEQWHSASASVDELQIAINWAWVFSKTTTTHDLAIGLFINRYELGRPI
jgi:hypothetical protein